MSTQPKDEPQNQVVNQVVNDELELLDLVRDHLKNTGPKTYDGIDYDAELIALRDAIGDARAEDIPPLVEQMTRLQALAAQRVQNIELPADPASPYFGHIRLEEKESTRDVLLGKRTYLAPEAGVRIVDWRHAPVSRIFYSYDQEDDYEEEFGGKVRVGRILARRSVSIQNGRLERIASPEGVFVRKKDGWADLGEHAAKLSGGQGTATRAEQLKSVGKLGVDADGMTRRDKHLPEIAALLDRDQFELISTDHDDLMVIQGSAGSGKTTVGLHRIAYLAFQEPERFRPHRMMVVAFNEALVSYVSRVLPALGVKNVKAVNFIKWAKAQRRKHVPGFPQSHSDITPRVVTRFKKHPSMLRILDDVIDSEDEQITKRFKVVCSKTSDGKKVFDAWMRLQRLPVDVRRNSVERWITGRTQLRGLPKANLSVQTETAVQSFFKKIRSQTEDVVSSWADLFTDREALGDAAAAHAPTEFSEAEIDTVHKWCVDIYKGIDRRDDDDEPVIDYEDEAILLKLYQLKRGWLRAGTGKLSHDHIMIDEVQDFSPLEISVLMNTIEPRRPVTLAGDTAQKIVRESGFTSWDDLLYELGVKEGRVETLEVAYRSTQEIMKLSRDVLGHLAGPESFAPRHGAPVELHRFTDPGQSVGFLGEALRGLAVREPMANVAVIARHAAQARLYYEGLKKTEVPRLDLVLEEDFSFSPGVEVTEIRQTKGLEFDYVVLVEVNADSYPNNDESRHLLHVGATRAAHQLWIISTSVPSPILPSWLLDNS